MSEMLTIEWRKLIRRKEIYVLTFLILFASLFIVFQLSTDSPILTINTSDGGNISLAKLTHGILNILYSTGILVAMLAIIIWNLIGKEMDQKIISHYFVNSKNRHSVFLPKMLLGIFVIGLLLLLFTGSFVLFSFLMKPDIVELSYTLIDVREFGKIFLLHILLCIIYTLFAFLFSLFFGSMGVLIGTIGVSLGFTLLKFISGTDSFNPLVINNIYSLDTISKSIFLDLIYILILGSIFFLVSNKKDI